MTGPRHPTTHITPQAIANEARVMREIIRNEAAQLTAERYGRSAEALLGMVGLPPLSLARLYRMIRGEP